MITILGAKGFIGSHLVKLLKENNIEYYAPERNEELNIFLGDIIYCIGLTADFREKPFETVEAHVCKLSQVLNSCNFDSLTYLSSARVYINCKVKRVNETAIIPIDISDMNELYTLTKLTGERICLSSGKKVKIIRLSNIYGDAFTDNNFLTQIIKTIVSEKAISFNLFLSSSKDYISIDTASKLIIQIAIGGKDVIYNVASGINISNEAIVTELKKHFQFSVDVSKANKEIVFPEIDIRKIKQEFGYSPENIIDQIENLINKYSNVSN